MLLTVRLMEVVSCWSVPEDGSRTPYLCFYLRRGAMLNTLCPRTKTSPANLKDRQSTMQLFIKCLCGSQEHNADPDKEHCDPLSHVFRMLPNQHSTQTKIAIGQLRHLILQSLHLQQSSLTFSYCHHLGPSASQLW